MRIYHFSEQPCPDAWAPEHKSLRVVLPSRNCDPRVMAENYHHRLDEWMLADELGLDIMINEHHATATCCCSVAAVPLAILARQTKRARLLTLGYPIANRLDPVRVAEEFAMIDVISRGRLEMGLVRGVPYEVPLSVRSAVGQMGRFWEAHDLIVKAMTSIDGPFDWQGEHFQYRNVNVWPRVYQQPHPPVWITGRSPQNIREIAERGYVLGTFLSGFQTKELFDHYRKACADLGRPAPAPDRFSYLGLVAIAQDRKEAMRRAEVMVGYLRSSGRVAEPFGTPPGYFSVKDAARMIKARGKRGTTTRDGKFVDTHHGAIEDLVKAGIMFVGTPDDVTGQLQEFIDGVGGLGHFLMAGVAGHEKVAQAADAVDKFLQLAGHVVGRADEHDARLDQVLDRAVVRVDELAVARHRAALASRLDHARGVLHRKIAGRRAEGLGDDPRGAQIAGHDLGAAPGFLPVLGDRHQPEVGEPVGRRRGPTEISAGLAVVIEQFLRLEAREERAQHVAALGDLADVLGAPARDPHRRVRLLVDARPDVDVAVLKMLALPVERAVDRGHRLDDQVVRFPEAVHLPDRRAHRERHFIRHAAHQSHLQAPARDHVDHRELLGDAHRIETVGDRVAEREQPRALGLPR